MIIVTGASGKLGRGIVQQMILRVSPEQIGVSVRDPDKVADLRALGVRVRQGDFDDADSLKIAFEGARQVLIVSSNARATGGDPLEQHRTAIETAREAGAARLIYTSHMGVSATSAFPPMHDHAATEEMLQESGLPWTALRHGFYASSGVDLMGDVALTGVIAAPADGPVAWTAHADLAETAAMVLAEEGRFDGPTPPLTGAEALDLDDLAAIVSELLGRSVRRKVIGEADLRAKMAERGAPPAAAAIALGLYAAARAGEFATVDPTLERLLGRSPTTMRDMVAERIR